MNHLFSSSVFVFVTILFVDCCFQMPGIQIYLGCLLPMDPRVCVSDSVPFTCTLRDNPVPNKTIRFRINTRTSGDVWTVVDEADITVVNISASVYTHTVRVSDVPLVTVQCFYSESPDGNIPTLDNQLGGISSVMASYPSNPLVADFSCIANNFVESLNCSWKYDGYYEDKPTVSFNWRISGFQDWISCPDLSTENNYCYITEQGQFSTKMIDVLIVLNYETCGENPERNITFNYTVDTRKIVKPNPVDGLTGVTINSTCVKLDWNTANSRPEYSKLHEIKAVSKWNDNKTVEVITGPTDFKAIHTYTLCDLQEYTKYTFTVRIKPVEPTYGGYWCDVRSTNSWTSSAVPSASPNVSVGGYSWDPRVCQSENTRRVCFMLQSIDGKDENGDMKGLEVICKPDTVDSSPSIDQHVFAEDSTYFCTSLSCTESYHVMLTAINDAGKSNITSTIYVEKWTDDIVQPTLKVETNPDNNQTLYLTWSHPPVSNAIGYIVYHCTKYNGGCKLNEGIMEWQSYPLDTQVVEMDIESAELFSYGVSLLTETGSSGLQWETCVYTKGVCPTKAVEHVVVSTGSEDDTLVVNWDKLPCQSGEPYIDSYIITYCRDSTSTCYDEEVSGNSGIFVIDDLEQQKYSVKVKGVNGDGCSGPYSNHVYGTPDHKALTPVLIVFIVVACILVVSMAVIGLVCCLRNSKVRFNNWKQDIRAISLPTDTAPDPCIEPVDGGSTLSHTYNRQRSEESDDSGLPGTPNPEEFKKPEFKAIKDGYCIAVSIDPITEEGDLVNVLSDLQNTENNNSLIVQNAQIVGCLHDHTSTVAEHREKSVTDTDTVSNLNTTQSGETGHQDTSIGTSSAYNKATLPHINNNRTSASELGDSDNNMIERNMPYGTLQGLSDVNEKLITLTSIPKPVGDIPAYLQLSTAEDDSSMLPISSSNASNTIEQTQYEPSRQSSNQTPNPYVSTQFICGTKHQSFDDPLETSCDSSHSSNHTLDSDISTSVLCGDNNTYISNSDQICNIVNAPLVPNPHQVDTYVETPNEYGVDNLIAPQTQNDVSSAAQIGDVKTGKDLGPNENSLIHHEGNKDNETISDPSISVTKPATSRVESMHSETVGGTCDYTSNENVHNIYIALTTTTPYIDISKMEVMHEAQNNTSTNGCEPNSQLEEDKQSNVRVTTQSVQQGYVTLDNILHTNTSTN